MACSNLFGVDIQQVPLSMAKMRLSLNLLSSVRKVGEVEPLPNLDYSLSRGNSLIGVHRVGEKELALLAQCSPRYEALVATINTLVRHYQNAIGNPITMLEVLREKGAAIEEPGGDDQQRRIRKGKQSFSLEDMAGYDPFHWAFDFDEVVNKPWWNRLDRKEVEVSPVNGAFRVRFGFEPLRSSP